MDAKPYTLRYLTCRDLQDLRERATLEGRDQWTTWRLLVFPSRSAAKRWIHAHRPAYVYSGRPSPYMVPEALAGAVAAP